jgi:4-amino-4-deoxy-L-arabinose transferase-like glycosyltransferase
VFLKQATCYNIWVGAKNYLQKSKQSKPKLSLGVILGRIPEKVWLWLVVLIVIFSRWLGHSKYLYDSDSALYALAINNYDVSIYQAHPLGCPLYVLLAKAFYWMVGDANTALVLMSILFSVLASLAVFFLAKKIYGKTNAWVSLLLFIGAPLVFFHGQIASNYIIDAFFATWFSFYVYIALQKEKSYQRATVIATVILALGAGFRPSLLILLLPLWLLMIIRTKSLKLFLTDLLVMGGVCLSWFLPMIWLGGGVAHFWQASKNIGTDFFSISVFSQGFEQALLNAQRILSTLWTNFSLAWVVVIFWLISFLPSEWNDKPKINLFGYSFWWWWIVPSLALYILVIFNVPGYLIIIIPALTILLSQSIIYTIGLFVEIFLRNDKRQLVFSRILVVTTAFFIASNLFTYYRTKGLSDYNQPVYATIFQLNKLWDNLIPTIRKEFNPQSSIIGIREPFVHWGLSLFQYYLPEYEVYSRIYPGFYNPENKNWFLAHNQQLALLGDIAITPQITQMIIIRGDWSAVSWPFSVLSLKDAGFLSYYDLTDPYVREMIPNAKDLKLIE